MNPQINADRSQRATADTSSMPWTASPSGSVSRKRVHLSGATEAGQVTSVVRYEAGAEFPAHDHPEGEEILVLEGVFSDEHGDWPRGTYLLNPEGFRHAPYSRDGCILFVKLRQFPGETREHVALDTESIPWTPTQTAGRSRKTLYSQAGFADSMSLERWAPGTDLGRQKYDQGVEIFVLEGEFEDEQGRYPARSWLRLPPDASHHPVTLEGCTLYMKHAGLADLRPL